MQELSGIPRMTEGPAQVPQKAHRKERCRNPLHHVRISAAQRIQDRHAQQHGRQIPRDAVDAVRVEPGHFKERKLPEILHKPFRDAKAGHPVRDHDENKPDDPRNEVLRQHRPDLVQQETQCVSAQRARSFHSPCKALCSSPDLRGVHTLTFLLLLRSNPVMLVVQV